MADLNFSLADLARAMDRASDDIKRDVVGLLNDAARKTKADVQAAYPVGPARPGRTPGRLRGQVYLTQPRSYSTSAQGIPIPVIQVRATAPHVHIYQEGTRDRFDATRHNARRGVSPAHGRIFQAIAARNRSVMLAQAQQIVDAPREL